LKTIEALAKGIYIPRGVNTPALDRDKKWYFTGVNFKVGDHVSILSSILVIVVIEKLNFKYYYFCCSFVCRLDYGW